MTTLALKYDPDSTVDADQVGGWYLPCAEPMAWVAACAQEPDATTRYYLAPHSYADRTTAGLIAIRTAQTDPVRSNASSRSVLRGGPRGGIPLGAIPLVCWHDTRREIQLWLPVFAKLSLDVSRAELFAIEQWEGSARFLWLPPDEHGQERLIRLNEEEEVDISLLLKPPTPPPASTAEQWIKPPVVPTLPERVLGLEVDRDLFGADLFSHEQQAIGGDSDDLMSIDEEGRPTGGTLRGRVGRWFRRALIKFNQKQGTVPTPSSKEKSSPKRSAAASGGRTTNFITAKMAKLLKEQREKQVEKLLKLMARDPDRALKYALPMQGQGAPRGLGQSGSQLGQHDIDFSLSELFGGGQAADYWQLGSSLQSQLMAAYRQQAEREMAAGRYRRAAYIYGHLLGDIRSAAMTLEKGKYFVEAAVLYEKKKCLNDQARCLRHAGQLTEAARIYERLNDFEQAAKMWQDVGDHTAARQAYERACELAIQRFDILKAVEILEKQLDDVARAEALLWQQWPRGHQVLACVKLGFQRLAETGRFSEAHRRLDEIVETTDKAQQTLLARLCAELHTSYPERAFRQRVEDRCRLAVADQLASVQRDELMQRMHILGSLHPSDTLLQRDTRRYQRDSLSRELRLQPDPATSAKRSALRQLSSVRLADGIYTAAMMIHQQLFTVSEVDENLQFSRYAQLTQEQLAMNSCRAVCAKGGEEYPIICRATRGRSPEYIYVERSGQEHQTLLLTSPLGGDDFWLINLDGLRQDALIGIDDENAMWRWCSDRAEMCHIQNLEPRVIGFSDVVGQTVNRTVVLDIQDAIAYENDKLAMALSVVHGRQPFVPFRNCILTYADGQPQLLTMLRKPVRWMVPSLPLTVSRLLVATANELYIVPGSPHARAELIHEDDSFTQGIFLPGGRIAATTERELLLFHRVGQGMRLLERHELQTSRVIALLSLSAETLGVLYHHGTMQRYRIG